MKRCCDLCKWLMTDRTTTRVFKSRFQSQIETGLQQKCSCTTLSKFTPYSSNISYPMAIWHANYQGTQPRPGPLVAVAVEFILLLGNFWIEENYCYGFLEENKEEKEEFLEEFLYAPEFFEHVLCQTCLVGGDHRTPVGNWCPTLKEQNWQEHRAEEKELSQ